MPKGRPFLPESERRSQSIVVRLTPAEKRLIERRAGTAITLSEWVRRRVLTAAPDRIH